MIKAYLYPKWFGNVFDNDECMGELACRVEVTLLGIPKKDDMIYDSNFDNGVAQDLFNNCKEQLLNMKSITTKVLDRFREMLKESEYNDERVLAKLSNIELLKVLIFKKYLDIGTFADGIWSVEEVNMYANDEHLHIVIRQEI